MTEQPGRDDSTTVLTAVRAVRAVRDQAEIEIIESIIDWCVLHQTDDEDAASFGDHGIPLAGDGAPWVLESAVLELCAALGQSTDAGKRHVGVVLEVRYRLPRTWERVACGDLPFWKARSVAEQTMCLPEAGAVFVDRHVAHVAHSVSYLQLKRLVEEAQTRYDPTEAENRARAAADGRHVSIHLKDVGINGTVDVTGSLDLRDALDLDDALNRGATALGLVGCVESHDVRRSLAAGDLARGQQSLPSTKRVRCSSRRGVESCCTSTSPKQHSKAPQTGVSPGSRTPGPRSGPTGSATGAPAPTSRSSSNP